MYDIERKQKILDILNKKKSCSVSELAKLLSFSEATIRRDLRTLEQEMKLRKTFGGAVIVEQYSAEVPNIVRQSINISAKEQICRAATQLLHDNMTLFLAASSTVNCLIPYLHNYSNLTIITNSPEIPQLLSNSNITVYCTGGKLLHYSSAYIGEFAKNTIRNLNADLMFFSARGISLNGKVTNSSTEEDIQRTMMENSAHVCLLADYSKVGKTYPFAICQLKEVHTVITDKPFPECLDHPNVIVAKH